MKIHASGVPESLEVREAVVKELTGLGAWCELVGEGLIVEYFGNEPGVAKRVVELFESFPYHIVKHINV